MGLYHRVRMTNPRFPIQVPPTNTRPPRGPLLFGLGVLGLFVVALVVLVMQREPDAVDDDELTALINSAEPEEPLSPYYLEAAASERASIQIDSNPVGAIASLDAEIVGLTPLGLSGLRPGYYDIRVDHPDHLPLDTTLYLASGAVYQLDVLLDPRAGVVPETAADDPVAQPGAPPATPRRDRVRREGRPAPGGVTAPPPPVTTFARADAETIKRVWTTGSLSVTSTPAGAQVAVDGQPRGSTPISVTTLPPGAHTVTLTLPGRNVLSYTAQVEAGAVYRLEASFD